MMGSRLCEPCNLRWPYRQRFFTYPCCGGPTGFSSAHAMPSDEADKILRGLTRLRADAPVTVADVLGRRAA